MPDRLADAAAALLGTIFPPDPGLLRLLAALHATLAGLLTLVLVVLLGAILPPSLAPSVLDRILGFAVGLFAGASVRDPTGRQWALTLALVPLAALASCTATALLQSHPLARRRWCQRLCSPLPMAGFADRAGRRSAPSP